MVEQAGGEEDRCVVSREPLNAETRLEAQSGVLTPTRRFYVRGHFAIPEAPRSLVVDGAVARELDLSVDELRTLDERTLVATLECAGNGRAFLEPPTPGEPWRLGAVSTAAWTGVPLRAVLELAGPSPKARAVLFVGADAGEPKDLGRRIAYERALDLERALHEDTLLAYAMNGEPLPPEHGAPLRLVVPGWYGMASVKWLARINVRTAPFVGFYQTERYVIDGAPLREIEPRAVIVSPGDGESLSFGPRIVRGFCWSGRAPIVSVAVSDDDGATWREARLGAEVSRYAWRTWDLEWTARAAGGVTLLARARDASGAVQPSAQRWNALGYANNAIQSVRVTVA